MHRNSSVSRRISLALIAVAPAALAQQPVGKRRAFFKGLDGGDYLVYKLALMKQVQEALKSEGLYDGEIDGKLEESTMKAIAEYQSQKGLAQSGVPTPKTRELLLGGKKSEAP